LKEDGILLYKGKVYVPNSTEMKNIMWREMQIFPYVGHSEYQKSITIVRRQYFWTGTKKEVVNYITQCLECQKVKIEHIHPSRLLQPFPISKWKWEVVTVDFITKLPIKVKQHDSIMVVVDKLTKVVHFIHVKKTHRETNITEICMKEVFRIHGVPKAIVSDRDSKFTPQLWQGLFKGFGTNLNLTIEYHPESYGNNKRTNRIIEDMIRMYVMDQPSKWEDCIRLVKFSYNNGYQASLKMSPFEALSGRKCNTLVSWDNPTDRATIGPIFVKGIGRAYEKDQAKFKGYPR
jgi:hypothetical protein